MEDARGRFEPAATEGFVWGEKREGVGIETAKSGGSVEGEGVEGPVPLGEEWDQERVA